MNSKRLNLYLILIIISNLLGYNSNSIDWHLFLSKSQTKLDARVKRIFNLNGIQKFSNKLIGINLLGNKISDIGLLKNFDLSLVELNLKLNMIENIEPLRNLINLQDLDIASNRIENIQPLENLTKLISLKIYENKIKQVDFIFSKFSNLVEVIAANNHIKEIRIASIYRTSLERIFMGDNQIESFENIGLLTNLNRLELNSNNLVTFDEKSFSKLKKLNNLFLDNNRFTSVEFLQDQTNFEELYLSNNLFDDDAGICKFLNKNSALFILHLNKNFLSNCDCIFEKIPNIFELELSSNKFKSINLNTHLVKLDNLNLENNKELNELNINYMLFSLTRFSAKNCNLSNLNFLTRMPYLKSLQLSFNQIFGIEMIKHLTRLETLYLDDNQIESISALKHLNNLVSLSVLNNKIKSLDLIGHLSSKLHSLYADNNQIENADLIQNFSQLNTISLSNNHIDFEKNLPDRIVYLDLSRNGMKKFDFKFLGNKLAYLNLSSNQLEIQRNNFTFLINQSSQLLKVDLSFNQINTNFSLLNQNNNEYRLSSSSKLKFIYIDSNLIEILSDFKRFITLDKETKILKNYVFLRALFILTSNDLKFGDCKMKLDFLRRNIHFNLYNYEQMQSFFTKCISIDLNDS